MCVSAWPAAFSKTITGTWEVMVDGKLQHVLWYQNQVGIGGGNAPPSQLLETLIQQVLDGASVESFASVMAAAKITEDVLQEHVNQRLVKASRGGEVKPVKKKKLPADKGNCLIIPLLGKWPSIKLLNTTSAPDILSDIQHAVRLPLLRSPLQAPAAAFSGGGITFLTFDIYDIVLAENALDIPAVLGQIKKEKQPKVNDAVFKMIHDWYACPVAVCCFSDAESGESKPLAFTFEPLYPDTLTVYTFDGHDGKVPDPKSTVRADHTIFVGSYLTDPKYCGKIKFTNKIAANLKPYLLNHVMGTQAKGLMENGDFIFQTKAVRAGHFEGYRGLPPKAPRNIARSGKTLLRPDAYEHS